MPKPGDHPDFFRLAPPEGRSRESSIQLDESGFFWHDGARVEHPAMQRAFARWLARHPEDGRYILQNGYDWTYLTVKDAPFFVRGVSFQAERPPVLTLSDATTEELDPASLCVDERGALYCSVKGGSFEARFLPGAETALAPYLSYDSGESVLFCVGGSRWPIPPRQPPLDTQRSRLRNRGGSAKQ